MIAHPDKGSHGWAVAACWRCERGDGEDRRSEDRGARGGLSSGHAAHQQSRQAGLHRLALSQERPESISRRFIGTRGAWQDAIAIVGVDQVLPEEIQERIRTLLDVRYVKEALSF